MSDDKYELIWKEIWEKATNNNIGADQINAFFSRLHLQAFSEGFIMLTADTEFVKKWVESNYMHVIESSLEDIYGKKFTVAIEVDTTQNPVEQPEVNNQQVAKNPSAETPFSSKETQQAENNFASEYSFDNFVVGSSNQLAYSMALSVAETPGQDQWNPLFLYGKSGLGKTHLLRAVQNYVSQNYPQLKTVYVDTNELVNDYTEASINKTFDQFKRRYNDADMVLIDDVQYLQGKPGSINVVFQLLNSMKDRGKQIIFSADRAPKHIDIDERTQTRFNSGVSCDIQPPETETKLGIIRNYIEECRQSGAANTTINQDVQNYVAQNSSSNIRELKGAINNIFIYARSLNKNEVNVEEVSQLLRDHFSGGSMKRLAVADVQKAVEQYFNVSHADLVGRKRSANIAHARHVAIYLCRTMIDIPYDAVGKEFNRDHATAMYSVTQIEEKKKESREINEELEILRQIIMDQ